MRIFTLMLFAVAAGLTGCTSKSNTQTVSISFPDWNALQSKAQARQSSKSSSMLAASASSAHVELISINVSGEGVTDPVVFSWKRSNDTEIAPSSATFTVPMGALVQALAMIEGTGATAFYYGDAVVASAPTQTLDITLENIAASQNVSQGKITGRYLTGANSGPTGRFQYRFAPAKILGGAKPSMIVEQGEVFSGWMNAFAMGSGLIEYTWADGQPAFVANASDGSLLSVATKYPQRSVRVRLPAAYENESRSVGSYYMTKQDRKLLTFGYFGPYADQMGSLRVCLPAVVSEATAPFINGLYDSASDIDPHATPGNQLRFFSHYTGSSSPGAVVLGAADLGSSYVQGGSTAVACPSSGKPFTDYLVLDGAEIAHGDGALGTKGPFAKSGSDFLSATYVSSSQSVTLSWALLPGTAAGLSGVSIFYRSVSDGTAHSTDSLRSNDLYDCARFASAAAYSPVFTEVQVGIGTTASSIPGIASFLQADSLQILACPKGTDGKFYGSAVSVGRMNSLNAALKISEAPTYDFGAVPTTVPATKLFMITNEGSAAATSVTDAGSLANSFAYTGGAFPGSGGTCSSTLNAGVSCSVEVAFAPTVNGPRSSTLTLNYNDGAQMQSVARPLNGDGRTPAVLSLDFGSHAFGNLEQGVPSDFAFTVTNSGSFAATGLGYTGLDSVFNLNAPMTTCTGTLPSGASCTIVIRAVAVALAPVSGSLTIGWTTPGAVSPSTTIALSVTGVAPLAPTMLALANPLTTPNTASAVTVNVQGLAVGDRAVLFIDGTCSGSSDVSTAVPPGNSSITVTKILAADGPVQFRAKRLNAAGYSSSCSSANVSYTRDTTPPVLASVSNFSPGVAVHWTASPVMRVFGTFANDTIKVYSSASACAAGTPSMYQLSNVTSTTSVDVTVPTLTLGHYTFYFAALDALDNRTACFGPVVYDYDTTNALVTFVNYSEQVVEGGFVSIPVQISMAKPYDVTVNYRATGSAVPSGVGSLGASGSVTILAGQVTGSIAFNTNSISGDQGNRYADVALYDTSYAYVSAAGSVFHRVSIVDNSTSNFVPSQLPGGFYSGYALSCYIDANKKLYCMGRGLNGAVGDGTATDRTNYVAILPTENFAKVATGFEHACAMTAGGGSSYPTAGTVLCWGSNTNGQLGDNTTVNRTTPQVVTSLGQVNDISVGYNFSCAIKTTDSKLYCWGFNQHGQVLQGSTQPQKVPVALDGATQWSSVALGYSSGCGVKLLNNHVACWGRNYNGATGNGTTTDGASLVTEIEATVTYEKVVMGDYYGCGLVRSDDVTYPSQIRCWGSNSYGVLGRGNTVASGVPAAADGVLKYKTIAAGRDHACGITLASQSPAAGLRCAGRSVNGSLIDATVSNGSTTFITVKAGTQFKDVSAGYGVTFAESTTNEIFFGGSRATFVGAGDGISSIALASTGATPFDPAQIFSGLESGSGAETTTCALLGTKIRCAGSIGDTSGLFGLGSAPDMTGYIWVDPKNDYLAVTVSRYNLCAIRTDGHLFCAGKSMYNGTSSNSATLVAVDSANTFTTVQAGPQHTCAILSDGRAKCWGVNSNGQVGDGSLSNRSTPVLADVGYFYSKIAVGFSHTCGITAGGGAIRCWGLQSNGRLGNGATGALNFTSGVAITDASVFTNISAGYAHTCAISTGNALKCWGMNSVGQLGDGTIVDRGSVVEIDAGTGYLRVGAGTSNSCALRADGKLLCWGDWTYGIAGTFGSSGMTPQVADGGYSYTDLSMGRYRACGLTTSNSIRCFGSEDSSSWGDFTRPLVPAAIHAVGFNR